MKHYITIKDKNKIKQLEIPRVYFVNFELQDGKHYDFMIHRHNTDEKIWVISEPVSGYRVYVGTTTKKKTIEDGRKFIKTKVNMKLLGKAIKDSKEKLKRGNIDE
jgi:hypothetical protein